MEASHQVPCFLWGHLLVIGTWAWGLSPMGRRAGEGHCGLGPNPTPGLLLLIKFY